MRELPKASAELLLFTNLFRLMLKEIPPKRRRRFADRFAFQLTQARARTARIPMLGVAPIEHDQAYALAENWVERMIDPLLAEAAEED